MREPTLHLLPRDVSLAELAAVVADVQREASQSDQWASRSMGDAPEVAVGPRSPWGRGLFPETWGPAPVKPEARATWARNKIVLGQHEARAGRRPDWLDADADPEENRAALIEAQNRVRQLRLLARRWGP